jgi:hypothetical protein
MLFLDCSRHKDYQVRAGVGISALVCHRAAPEDLAPVYMATIEDKHPHVPLLVMRKGWATKTMTEVRRSSIRKGRGGSFCVDFGAPYQARGVDGRLEAPLGRLCAVRR